MSRLYPIFTFYSSLDNLDGEQRNRQYAGEHEDACEAALKLQWLEFNLAPEDYEIETMLILHSEREETPDSLDAMVRSIYGYTDPYVYVVAVEFYDNTAADLFQLGVADL